VAEDRFREINRVARRRAGDRRHAHRVRGLAKQIEAGESPEVLRGEYDYIDPATFEFAVHWARGEPDKADAAANARGLAPAPAPLLRCMNAIARA
jgi:hypothetical protein